MDGRTEAAIELKHRNISAVLAELDLPAIPGYNPLPHYRKALIAAIIKQLGEADSLDALALDAVQRPATPHAAEAAYEGIEVPAPEFFKAESPRELLKARQAVRRDYLDRESRNASLGAAGEEFVVSFERWRLTAGGKSRLADRVEHVSRTRGDGLGYDIESFEVDGRPRPIEVKTTCFGRHTPFFISNSELTLAKAESELFVLSRVFEFRRQPKLFHLRGPIEDHCNLDPISYRARFFWAFQFHLPTPPDCGPRAHIPPHFTRHLASLLALPVFALIAAPCAPDMRFKAALEHPMIPGVKAWALAHLLSNGTLGDLALIGPLIRVRPFG